MNKPVSLLKSSKIDFAALFLFCQLKFYLNTSILFEIYLADLKSI